MKKIFVLLSCLHMFMPIYASEVSHTYKKDHSDPGSAYEASLVQHTKESFEKAMRGESKLQNTKFSQDIICKSAYGIIPYFHMVNNLCSLKNASHLHIGLYTGGSFVSSLYGNETVLSEKVGIDWYIDDAPLGHKEICINACKKYLKQKDYKIVVANCFAVDLSLFKKPVDIYVYDAGHTMLDHEMAFTYYDKVFSKSFIAVVDDWNWSEVRLGTFKAFDELEYEILYECEIPAGERTGNGQYIAVIRKNS